MTLARRAAQYAHVYDEMATATLTTEGDHIAAFVTTEDTASAVLFAILCGHLLAIRWELAMRGAS
jgi:hypothetical protein